MNTRERQMLEKRYFSLQQYIKSQSRLKKADRNQRAIADAKARCNTLKSWLNG